MMMRFFSAFRNASKWSKFEKKVRYVQGRIKFLKNKKDSMIRHLQEDTARLIEIGQDKIAFARVEKIVEDQSLKEAYEMLDMYCEFVSLQLPYIRKRKDCPNDVNEAVSSLLYASGICGDLPELSKLCKRFKEHYGETFTKTAINLLPGNLVNNQLVEKLNVKAILFEEQYRLMKEFARDYNVRSSPPEIKNALLHEYHPVCNYTSTNQEVENGNQIYVEGIQKTEERKAITEEDDILETTSIVKSGSSSSLYSQISESNIVYLDDIEEFKASSKEDAEEKDQRGFIFKLSPLPLISCGEDHKEESSDSDCNNSYIEDYEGVSETSDGETRYQSDRIRRIYVSTEKKAYYSTRILLASSMRDVEREVYYGGRRKY
ncbi:hypothetical protein GIB67_033766 [Kingdonia uniflora]|uniref:IST1-like protein n=1 Tax=Kingdonia uniflora TaxID=39325 RepID=A0A7J7P530_9MAGN|nr:hypothetical protein GIB67_033766 [Kingdonia uniflora]